MDLLIPLLGYILAVAGSFLLMKWVAGKANNAIGGGISGLLDTSAQILEKPPVRTALRGAESVVRSAVGSAAIAGSGVGVAVGAAAKGAGKATQAVANAGTTRLTGYVKGVADKKYKNKYEKEDQKTDDEIERLETELTKNTKANREKYLKADKTRSALLAEREQLNDEKEAEKNKIKADGDKRKSAIEAERDRIQKEKDELEAGMEQWRNSTLYTGERASDQTKLIELEAKLKQANADVADADADINAQLNQADADFAKKDAQVKAQLDVANSELAAARTGALRSTRAQEKLEARKEALQKQRQNRYNVFMDDETGQVTKIVTDTNAIFQKAGGALDTVGTGALHMLPFGVDQLRTVLTGKDLMVDTLYDNNGSMRNRIAANSGTTGNATNSHGKITADDNMRANIKEAQKQKDLEIEKRMKAIVAQINQTRDTNGEKEMAFGNNERIALKTMVQRADELTGTGKQKVTDEDVSRVFMEWKKEKDQEHEGWEKAATTTVLGEKSMEEHKMDILSEVITNEGLEQQLADTIKEACKEQTNIDTQGMEKWIKSQCVNDPGQMGEYFGEAVQKQYEDKINETQRRINIEVGKQAVQSNVTRVATTHSSNPGITDLNEVNTIQIEQEATEFMENTFGDSTINDNGTQQRRRGRRGNRRSGNRRNNLPQGA